MTPTSPKFLSIRPCLLGFFFFCIPVGGWAQMEEMDPIVEEDDGPVDATPQPEGGGGEPGGVMLEEFEVDARNVVLSAARTKTTIQEAPGIITVITAEEIRAWGHRTVNDVLRTIPGFEGNRYDSNGWFEEGFARGQPRTLLVLVNGVNITEPLRNGVTLDRKIPIDAIKRIEITSGPGGVLWGSNALLGVVNIILKDSADLSGLEVILGGGTGPGAQEAFKLSAAYGGSHADGDVEVFGALSVYSDRGAELETDAQKVLGVLPAPAPDGPTLYIPEGGVTDFNSRDLFVSGTLNLRLFEQFTVDALVTWERDYRQLATGGAFLRGSEAVEGAEDGATRPVEVETRGQDAVQMVGLGWRDRLLDDGALGLSLRLYGVRWRLDEDPFWAFPPSTTLAPLEDGVFISLQDGEVMRGGLNFDADLQLPVDNHLIFGVELFQDRVKDTRRGDVLRSNAVIPELADPGSPDPLTQRGIFGPGRCPEPGDYLALAGDEVTAVSFGADCAFTSALLEDTTRTVGAAYVSNEWKATRRLALQPGVRVQFSDAYDTVALGSMALVWNLVDQVFLKLNYAEGFRPPEIQSTNVAASVSNISFQGNPNLKVERSRAAEAELNAVVLERAGAFERLYLRADYAYTLMSDLVRNAGGRFVNSGQRGIHSVEWLARADLKGGHEAWLGGHFLQAMDSKTGAVRNHANWVFMGGAQARLLGDGLQLSMLATWVGPQEDLNRAFDTEERLAGAVDLRVSDAVDVEVNRIDPYLLLRLGLRSGGWWDDRLELSAFVYNALDATVQDPDFFFDDRVQSRPQPRPRWSGFGQASVRF